MSRTQRVALTRYYIIFILSMFCLHVPAYAASVIAIPEVNLKQQPASSKKQNIAIASTHFTQQDIENSPVIDLGEFFQQEQSVVRLTNNSADASQTALSLRGFGDNAAANSLILIDGFPLTNPSLLAPNFNSIPLTDIQRIDIFQGSQGSLWGDQAVGGVINIVTKHPRKFFANGIIGFGSYNNNYENILMGNKAENGLFFTAFAALDATQNYRHHHRQDGNNLAAQVGWDYARGTLSFNAQTYSDTTYFPGGLTEQQFNQNPQQATEFKNYSHYQTNLFQLLSKQELNDEWLLETRVSQHETHGNGYVYLNYNRSDWLATFNPQLLGNIGKNKFVFGYLGQLTHYELQNAKVNSRTNTQQNDLYMQATIPVWDKIDVTLGARGAEQTSRSRQLMVAPANARDRVLVTEQGLSFHPFDGLGLYVRRDGNFSFPKANEQTWVPENLKSLQVQTGTSYEAGAEWKTTKNELQLSVYRLALKNEIAFNPTQTVSQPFGAFNNLDATLRQGVSVTEKYHVTPQFTVNQQVNYVNARFAAGPYSGNVIPAVPTWTGNVGLEYAWTERWRTQYALLYTGNRYASEDIQNVGNRISGYWLNDIALQYLLKSVTVSVEVRNVFNQQYPTYAYYDTFIAANKYYPAAGRNYLLTVKINLD